MSEQETDERQESEAFEQDRPRKRGVSARIAGAVMLVVIVLCVGYVTYVGRSFVRAWPQAVLDSISGKKAEEATAAEEAVKNDDANANVEPKDSLASYSWDELRRIGDEIAHSGSAEAAHEIAATYHLANAEGAIDGSQTKEISLTNGKTIHAQLVGVYHDDASDGVRKAGLTFVTAEPLGTHAVNGSGSNIGGWRDSELRTWLANDGMALLPQDLTDVIKEVNKHTNNEGYSTSATCVTTTADKLWAPSWVELAGPIDRNYFSSGYEYCGDVQNAEGTQYEAFSLAGVAPSSASAQLARPQSASAAWWMRTAAPSRRDYFYYVTAEGNPSERADAADAQGVIAGFCL